MRAVTVLTRTPRTVRESVENDYRMDSLLFKLEDLVLNHGCRTHQFEILRLHQIKNITHDIGFICDFKGGSHA